MKSGKKNVVIVVLLALNIAGTIALASLFVFYRNAESKAAVPGDQIHFTSSANGEYTLYIGTNDKDTYTQKISTDEARNIVNSICVKYVDGYTSQDAKGGWVDETGKLTQENTLVYYLYGVSEKQVVSIMNDVLAALNQNSILVEVQNVNYAYYTGGK